LAAAIKHETTIDAKLIEGSGGIFLVKRDGEQIFSKHEMGRYPEHEEILSQLRNR
jgi:predicted Rdx family selenoprotein